MTGVVLGAADAPSGHIQARVLFTYFQTGFAELTVDAVLVVVAGAYLWAVGAVGRFGERPAPWPVARTAAFLAGLAAIFVAVGSGLAAYDDINPTAHVVQHALLMMVGAPLLVAGRPLVLLSRALSGRARRRVARIAGNRVLGLATGWPAAVAYVASMALYFLTGWYAASVRFVVLHDATHLWFLAVGCLYWTGVLGPETAGHRRSTLFRGALVLAAMPAESAIGVALLLWPHGLAPGLSVGATHRAGVVFWVIAMLTCGVALAALLGRWMLADERIVRRLELARESGADDALRARAADGS